MTEFKAYEFMGMTHEQRIKRVSFSWAEQGYRVTRLTLPPKSFYYLEHCAIVCESGLAVRLLGEIVPIAARYDGVKLCTFEVEKTSGGPRVAIEVDIYPDS